MARLTLLHTHLCQKQFQNMEIFLKASSTSSDHIGRKLSFFKSDGFCYRSFEFLINFCKIAFLCGARKPEQTYILIYILYLAQIIYNLAQYLRSNKA